jgi:hypothetical protein
MSASASSQPSRIAPPEKRTHMSYGEIMATLKGGLIPYVTCFVKKKSHLMNSDKVKTDFIAAFDAAFNPKIGSPKDDFELFGNLLFVKSGNTKMYKLTVEDNLHLQKRGVIPGMRLSTEQLVSDFFKRHIIEEFIKNETAPKYHEQLLLLMDTVYTVITGSVYPIEDEEFLQKFNKEGKPLRQEFGDQPALSALDLRFQNATQSLGTINANLIKLKGKSTQVNKMTESFTRMRNSCMIAGTEYKNNILAIKSQKELAKQRASNATIKSELSDAKETNIALQAQLEQQARLNELELAEQKLEFERLAAIREEERLATLKLLEEARKREIEREQERLAALTHAAAQVQAHNGEEKERPSAQIHIASPTQTQTPSVSPNSAYSSESGVSSDTDQPASQQDTSASAAVSSPHVQQAKTTQQFEKLRKEHEALVAQHKFQMTTANIAEAKHTKISRNDLTKCFKNVISHLNAADSKEEDILKNFVIWGKSALAYITNKKSTKGEASVMTNAIRFLGQKTKLGKKITPEKNKDLKVELEAIITQSILVIEQFHDVNESVRALNQNAKNLTRHDQTILNEDTVSSQFLAITNTITRVAEARFGYVKPPRGPQG